MVYSNFWLSCFTRDESILITVHAYITCVVYIKEFTLSLIVIPDEEGQSTSGCGTQRTHTRVIVI